jgi:hypothetical protein
MQHFIDPVFLLSVQWLSLVQAYACIRLHNADAYKKTFHLPLFQYIVGH